MHKNGPIKRVPDGAVVYASRLGRRCAPRSDLRASADVRPRRTRSQLNGMQSYPGNYFPDYSNVPAPSDENTCRCRSTGISLVV